MTQQFTQEWVDLWQRCSDPMAKMSELNTKATSAWTDWLGEWNKQCTQMADKVGKSTPMDYAEKATSVWTDWLSEWSKLGKSTPIDYAQKATSVWTDWLSEWNKQCTQMADQMMKPTTGAARSTKTSKSGK